MNWLKNETVWTGGYKDNTALCLSLLKNKERPPYSFLLYRVSQKNFHCPITRHFWTPYNIRYRITDVNLECLMEFGVSIFDCLSFPNGLSYETRLKTSNYTFSIISRMLRDYGSVCQMVGPSMIHITVHNTFTF